MALLGKIEPQPPLGISYMIGGETWKQPEDRSPLRLIVEEWGNLGPMELRPEIKPNKAGFRVRHIEIAAPDGALGFSREPDGVYWTDVDMWGRTASEREAAVQPEPPQ